MCQGKALKYAPITNYSIDIHMHHKWIAITLTDV